MIRREAIELIAKKIGRKPIVSANGHISRDLYEVCDRDSNFYMIGSMGLASSIALGIALKNSRRRVYVFDGDGNILMNLGSFTTIGFVRPRNLIHIIFDNKAHESTGGQPTHTSRIHLDRVAKAANYKIFKIDSKVELIKILGKIKIIKGPILVLVNVEKDSHVSKRVLWNPTKIRDRFMNFLN